MPVPVRIVFFFFLKNLKKVKSNLRHLLSSVQAGHSKSDHAILPKVWSWLMMAYRAHN